MMEFNEGEKPNEAGNSKGIDGMANNAHEARRMVCSNINPLFPKIEHDEINRAILGNKGYLIMGTQLTPNMDSGDLQSIRAGTIEPNWNIANSTLTGRDRIMDSNWSIPVVHSKDGYSDSYWDGANELIWATELSRDIASLGHMAVVENSELLKNIEILKNREQLKNIEILKNIEQLKNREVIKNREILNKETITDQLTDANVVLELVKAIASNPKALAVLIKAIKATNHKLFGNKPLMTFDEVVEYLNISKSTAKKLLAEDKLGGVKVGNQHRFEKAVIDQYFRCGKLQND